MYITVFKYNTDNPIVCKCLVDAATMHRQIQYLFNSQRKDHDVLYRIDQGYLIVQSDIKPICNGCFELIQQYEMSSKLNAISEGLQYKFRLRTVPRVSDHGKKHYLKSEEDRVNWIFDQFKKRGATVEAVRECSKNNIVIKSKQNVKTGGDTKVSVWEYEGVFSIDDKEAFLRGYKEGIGTQKAYGCGMILLCG